MTTRKEMVPARERKTKHSIGLCNPEWQLLCRIRRYLQLILVKKLPAKNVRIEVKNIIVEMNDTFNDWPEDSK